MEFLHQPSSSTQFTFDDYDFSMAYGDFRDVRNYVKNKVNLLTGDSYNYSQRQVFRDPDDLTPEPQRLIGLNKSLDPSDDTETNNLQDVLNIQEIKEIGSFKISILQEALAFLQDISVNGVNGHRVGTILVIGDIVDLISHSTGEIPNPLKGHSREARSIFNGTFKGSLTQFSQFDGFTGMDWDGCVEFCGRLIEVPHDLGQVPDEIIGHGARHKAGWAISRLVPDCISLVLSQDGEILVIKNGKVLKKIMMMMEVVEPFITRYPPPLETYFEESGGSSSEGATALSEPQMPNKEGKEI